MQELIAYNQWLISNHDRFFQEYLNTLEKNNKIFELNDEKLLIKADLDLKEIIKKIQFTIKNLTGLHFSEYNVCSRKSKLIFSKHLFCYLVRKSTNLPYKEIGNFFEIYTYSNKLKGYNKVKSLTSSNVLQACNKIEHYIQSNSTLDLPRKQIILKALEKMK